MRMTKEQFEKEKMEMVSLGNCEIYLGGHPRGNENTSPGSVMENPTNGSFWGRLAEIGKVDIGCITWSQNLGDGYSRGEDLYYCLAGDLLSALPKGKYPITERFLSGLPPTAKIKWHNYRW